MSEINSIAELLKTAKKSVKRNIDTTMVYTYFEIGKNIVEIESKKTVKEITDSLNKEFEESYSENDIENMKNFYKIYSKNELNFGISEHNNYDIFSVRFDLSWEHYLLLIEIENGIERKNYEIAALDNNWNSDELKIHIEMGNNSTQYFSHIGINNIKNDKDILECKYILKFLGIK